MIPIRHELQDSRLVAVFGNTVAHAVRISKCFQRAYSNFFKPMVIEPERNPKSFLKREFLILLLQRAKA